MPRITHVKKAQQRYRTVPILNPDGTPKAVPVLNRDGTQKTTKLGKPVVRRLTEEDKDQPLPLHTCEHCGKALEVGKPYKHVTPKSGPYGGRTRYRCAQCPTWQPWDLSSALWARVAQIQHEHSRSFDEDDSPEGVLDALEQAAQAVRDLAEEKRQAAENMEEGFGHATSQTEELGQVADELDGWADALEETDVPNRPDPDDADEADLEAWVADVNDLYDNLLGQQPSLTKGTPQ